MEPSPPLVPLEPTPSDWVWLRPDLCAPLPPRAPGKWRRLQDEWRFGQRYAFAFLILLTLGILVGTDDKPESGWQAAPFFLAAAAAVVIYVHLRRRLPRVDLAARDLIRPLAGPHHAIREEIVSRTLAVAVLELEQRGLVALDGGPGELWLRPRPGATEAALPRDTPEAGLLRGRDLPVADAVYDFLADGSNFPWKRATRIFEHLVAKRGWGRPEAPTTRSDEAVRTRTLLASETQRAELWASLLEGIRLGIERRTVAPTYEQQGQFRVPRYDYQETPVEKLSGGAVDEDPYKDAASRIARNRRYYLLAAVVFAGATVACSFASWAWAHGYVVGLAVAAASAASSLLMTWRRRYWEQRGINPTQGREHLFVGPLDAAVGAAATGAFFALLSTLAGPWWGGGLAALLAVMVLVPLLDLIRPTDRQVGSAVTRRMRELKKSAPAVTSAPAEPPGPVAAVGGAPAIRLRISGVRELPAAKLSTRARFESWNERWRELDRVDSWSFGSSIALTLGYWSLFAVRKGEPTPVIFLGAPFVMAALWYAGERWKSRRRAPEIDPETEVPTSGPTRLFNRIWRLAALLAAVLHATSHLDGEGVLRFQPQAADFGWFGLFTAAFGLQAWATWGARQRVLRRLPLPAPRRLVMLRVFGSPSFDDLITLIRPWARVGTIEHLEGADSVGARDDVRTAAARGQIEDALVKSDEELMWKLAGLSLLPDADLRFHRHAFQCTGATWKRAILAMLDRADAVVMDLSSLSPANQGCAWELEQLMQRVPLHRVVLLVNDSTHLETLRGILAAGAARLSGDSPNAGPATLDWNVIRIGGLSARLENESYHGWLRRSDLRLEPMPLCEHLLEIAEPPRAPEGTAADPAWLARQIRPSARAWLIAFGLAWGWLAWQAG